MKWKHLAFGWSVFVAVAPSAPAATSLRSVTTASATTLAIDDVACGTILSWEGGDPRASVVTEPLGITGVAGKHLGNLAYAPLVVQMSFPPPSPVVTWINELCANQVRRRKVVLISFNSLGQAAEALEAIEVMLTEVRLPAFDGAATSPVAVTLVLRPEQCQITTPTSTSTSSLSAPTSAAQFSLIIAGLDSSQVRRIEPIRITQRVQETNVGEARVSTTAPAATEFSNLVVTLADADAATWKAWLNDFVVRGNNGNAEEKKGSIQILKRDTTPSGLAVNFSQLGIMRVSRMPVTAGTPPTSQVELYFEKLDLGAAAVTSSSAASSAATSAPPAAPTGTQTPAIVASTGATSPTVATPIASTVTNVATLPSRPTTSAVLAATSPADQGTRDPAEFPRVSGLTRINYSGTYQLEYTSEQANYTTPEEINQLVARVSAAAEAAGFALRGLDESDSTNGKSVSARWEKPRVTVSAGFLAPRTGDTKITLQVNVTKPATN